MFSRSVFVLAAASYALLAGADVANAAPPLEIHGRCAIQRVPSNNVYRDGSADPILYLNRCVGGCTVTPGSNDSRKDTTTVFDEPVTLSEFSHDDEVWNAMVECVREVMLPYDVTVTEEDPGPDALYLEAMIAGTSDEAGLGSRIVGISPIACTPLSHTISFTFANSHKPDARMICETVTHEAGHTLSLDHEVACSDLMWWTTEGVCGPKYFRDSFEYCGNEQPGECHCGGVFQNAHEKLLDAFGPGANVPPPTLAIENPTNGDNVSSLFVVHAFASDARGINRVELYINDWRWYQLDGHDWEDRDNAYVLRTSADLPDGILDVEVRAVNDLGVTSSDTLTLMKGAPCTSADTCLDGQYCEEGRCLWNPPTLAFGDACYRDQECSTLECVDYEGMSLCTSECDPRGSDNCGDGYSCVESETDVGFCWPAEGGGGCCSAGDRGGAHWAALALFVSVILLGSRRRSRSK